ncbi:MAG: 5-formyltetrahydrofolate cyclo-ligase, partial [Candidatus Omnitrophica bacterium]|nr:5-formyltetrahydrofolate cyclo-ligase [Candidatus Omnitrophota bacterium]
KSCWRRGFCYITRFTTMIAEEKVRLRKQMLFRLKNQPEKDRIHKNQVIFEKIIENEYFKRARIVMAYVSLSYEVSTRKVIRQALDLGKCVVVPWVKETERELIPVEIRSPEKDLIKGHYGIEEPRLDLVRPFEVEAIDLVLVPGLAFDRDNHRLGRGMGYFDRFLASLDSRTQTVGLAFDLQIIDRVPRLEHDIALSSLISN